MSVPFAALGLILLSAPLLTQRGFRELWSQQREYIAVDNAAIRLGRGLTKTLQSIAIELRHLESLEKAHHPMHLCANDSASSVAGGCQTTDGRLEQGLSERIVQLERWASESWREAFRASLGEAHRLGGVVVFEGLPTDPPFTSDRCEICQREFRLGWREGIWPLKGSLHVGRAKVGIELSLNGPSGAGYRLYLDRSGL